MRKVFKRAIKMVAVHFFQHQVAKNAAALAYYMLFSLFPLLIFVTNLLGLMDLNISVITRVLEQFLPRDVVGLVEAFLDHITRNSSHTLLIFSLVCSVWFPMQAVQGLMWDVRRAYGVPRPQRPVAYTLRQLAYTVVFLVAISLTLFLSILGKQVILQINRLLPEQFWQLSGYLLRAWQYLRFLPIGLLMMLAIGTLYAGSLDQRTPVKTVLPGIFVAFSAWMLVSVGFSFYVENFAHYSLIYGTLGAVIMLLMWLYLTAVVLILGAEFNAALRVAQAENRPEAENVVL